MLGFIRQIIIQYCDLIAQENKFLIKDGKSALIKLTCICQKDVAILFRK